MRYDSILWVLMAPALAACACFAFEMSCNRAESWNNRFEELRRGFEMLGRRAKPDNVPVSFHPAPEPNYAQPVVLTLEHKRRR
jgi:hypothetical protein